MSFNFAPLTDKSPMPFGRYAGTAMEDIPATYLMYFYENEKDPDWLKNKFPDVHEYIERNFDAIEMELEGKS